MSDAAPTVGSLFSGIGGFDLGLERAGFRVAFQCEIDAFRRRVLAKHFPGIPLYEDVRLLGRQGELDGAVEQVDLLCGGFPCQDLSVAGRRAGLAGERSGLFYEFARCADELVRPGGFVLIENVPGLFSSNGGRDFGIILATLGELGFHDLAWRVLDSRYFGVPQRRRRVFILGRRASGSLCREVLLDPDSLRGHPAPSWQEGPTVARSAQERARAPSVAAPLTKGSAASEGVSYPGRRQEDDHNLVAGPLTARYGKGINTTLDDGAIVHEKPIGEQIDDGEAVQALTTRFGNTGIDYPDAEAGWVVSGRAVPDAAGTLQASPNGYRHDADSAAGGHLIPDSVRPELAERGADDGERGGPHGGAGGAAGGAAADLPRGGGEREEADADRVRAPSGVPRCVDGAEQRVAMTTKLHNTKSNQAGKLYDGYSPSLQADSPAPAFLGDASEGDDAPADPPPDGPRYAALGDAVTVNVAEWIGVRLAFALQREAA